MVVVCERDGPPSPGCPRTLASNLPAAQARQFDFSCQVCWGFYDGAVRPVVDVIEDA